MKFFSTKHLKKFCLCLAVLLLSAALGCQKRPEPISDTVSVPEQIEKKTETPPQPVWFQNPLTGVYDLAKEKTDDRPVAIAINNISLAQTVQAGIGKADLVYETEVEGGITRLLALYQDVTRAERIGTVRSARYVFVDLALGHNAIYLHHGQDETYCKPHLRDIDDINLSENNYGFRVRNGLASEHTLYTNGEKLWSGLVADGRQTESNRTGTWVAFAQEDSPVQFDSTATTITVPFSSSYHTVFQYNQSAKTYTRYFGSTLRKDYVTGETTQVKNIFVLLTTIQNYADGYHRRVSLEGGDGYYCVNGTYTRIHWKKGNANNGFTFQTLDGAPLLVNPGNSWVCIANKGTSQPVFQ